MFSPGMQCTVSRILSGRPIRPGMCHQHCSIEFEYKSNTIVHDMMPKQSSFYFLPWFALARVRCFWSIFNGYLYVSGFYAIGHLWDLIPIEYWNCVEFSYSIRAFSVRLMIRRQLAVADLFELVRLYLVWAPGQVHCSRPGTIGIWLNMVRSKMFAQPLIIALFYYSLPWSVLLFFSHGFEFGQQFKKLYRVLCLTVQHFHFIPSAVVCYVFWGGQNACVAKLEPCVCNGFDLFWFDSHFIGYNIHVLRLQIIFPLLAFLLSILSLGFISTGVLVIQD